MAFYISEDPFVICHAVMSRLCQGGEINKGYFLYGRFRPPDLTTDSKLSIVVVYPSDRLSLRGPLSASIYGPSYDYDLS